VATAMWWAAVAATSFVVHPAYAGAGVGSASRCGAAHEDLSAAPRQCGRPARAARPVRLERQAVAGGPPLFRAPLAGAPPGLEVDRIALDCAPAPRPSLVSSVTRLRPAWSG
jgi:hypothetical protein